MAEETTTQAVDAAHADEFHGRDFGSNPLSWGGPDDTFKDPDAVEAPETAQEDKPEGEIVDDESLDAAVEGALKDSPETANADDDTQDADTSEAGSEDASADAESSEPDFDFLDKALDAVSEDKEPSETAKAPDAPEFTPQNFSEQIVSRLPDKIEFRYEGMEKAYEIPRERAAEVIQHMPVASALLSAALPGSDPMEGYAQFARIRGEDLEQAAAALGALASVPSEAAIRSQVIAQVNATEDPLDSDKYEELNRTDKLYVDNMVEREMRKRREVAGKNLDASRARVQKTAEKMFAVFNDVRQQTQKMANALPYQIFGDDGGPLVEVIKTAVAEGAAAAFLDRKFQTPKEAVADTYRKMAKVYLSSKTKDSVARENRKKNTAPPKDRAKAKPTLTEAKPERARYGSAEFDAQSVRFIEEAMTDE